MQRLMVWTRDVPNRIRERAMSFVMLVRNIQDRLRDKRVRAGTCPKPQVPIDLGRSKTGVRLAQA